MKDTIYLVYHSMDYEFDDVVSVHLTMEGAKAELLSIIPDEAVASNNEYLDECFEKYDERWYIVDMELKV
jgi:hypothetical protein